MGACCSVELQTDPVGKGAVATPAECLSSVKAEIDGHSATVLAASSPAEVTKQTPYTLSGPTNYPVGGFSRPFMNLAQSKDHPLRIHRPNVEISRISVKGGDDASSGRAVLQTPGPWGNWGKTFTLTPGASTRREGGDPVRATIEEITSLCQEVTNLLYIGSGASGHVYRGDWQGATVAIKYMISVSKENSAFAAAANEAIVGRLLAHPNVTQTFAARDVDITPVFLAEVDRLVELEKAAGASKKSAMEKCPVDTDKYASNEGFGDPLEKPPSVFALQEVLKRVKAQPGNVLTKIIMEYCDKGCLHGAIKRGVFRHTSKGGSRMAMRATLQTAREVAKAMYHIQRTGIIHGDLKPGNVLLKGACEDKRGFTAKIADFGLSRVFTETVKDDSSWATVHYMGPEALEGTITPQADVYAFGVCLWQMVTGRLPHEGLQAAQIMHGVLHGELPFTWPRNILPRLRELGEDCLALDYTLRPNFDYIMEELGIIESQMRLSRSSESSTSTSFSRRASSSISSPSSQSLACVVSPQSVPGAPARRHNRRSIPEPALNARVSQRAAGAITRQFLAGVGSPRVHQGPLPTAVTRSSPPVNTSASSSPLLPSFQLAASAHRLSRGQSAAAGPTISGPKNVDDLEQESTTPGPCAGQQQGGGGVDGSDISLDIRSQRRPPGGAHHFAASLTSASSGNHSISLTAHSGSTSVIGGAPLRGGGSDDAARSARVQCQVLSATSLSQRRSERPSSSSLQSLPPGSDRLIETKASQTVRQESATSLKGWGDLNPSYQNIASIMSLQSSPSLRPVMVASSQDA